MYFFVVVIVAFTMWDKSPNVFFIIHIWWLLLSTETTKYLFDTVSFNSNIPILWRSDSVVCCFCWRSDSVFCCFCWFSSVEYSCALWFFFWWIAHFLWYFIRELYEDGFEDFFFLHRTLVFASSGCLIAPLIQKTFSLLLALDVSLTHHEPQCP